MDKVLIKILVANRTDVTLRSDPHFKNQVIQPGPSAMDCLAEHGLALSVVTIRNGERHRYLFDMGGLKKTIMNNLNAFKIDYSEFEKVFLSHGHYDHWGAILDISQQLNNGIEFILNPEGLYPRFSLGKELTGTKIDLATLDFQQLKQEKKIRQLPDFPEKKFRELAKEKNFKLNFTNQPITIEPGVTTSGEISVSDSEEVTKGMLIRKNDTFLYDEFNDELSLYINIQDKGLIVITGCGHRGILNTIKHGQTLTGLQEIYAVIGGFHQNWASPERIRKTIEQFKALKPKIICGFHCTGFKFNAECMRQLPNQTTLAVVGTTFIL